MKFVITKLFLLTLLLNSCTKSTTDEISEPVVSNMGTANSCQNMISDSKITLFNQNQTQFQVRPAGYNQRCQVEEIKDGIRTLVEVSGHSAIQVLPNLKFVSADSGSGFNLIVQSVDPSTEEIKKIVSKLQITVNPASVVAADVTMPTLIYLENGHLFKINKVSKKENHYSFEIKPKSIEEQSVRQIFESLNAGSGAASLMWSPVNEIISQLSLGPNIKTFSWSRIDGLSLLEVVAVQSGGINNAEVFAEIVNFAVEWAINPAKLHQRLPEILKYAEDQWLNPVVTLASTKRMLYYLKYITLQNPSSPKKIIADAFESGKRFHATETEALQTAIDFSLGLTWTADQFNFLIAISNTLYPMTQKKSWTWSLAISQRASFDPSLADLAADLATKMLQTNFQIAAENVEPIFTKISQGITIENSGVYFKIVDSLKRTVKVTIEDADQASLLLVTTLRATESNRILFIELFNWLEDGLSLSFIDSFQVIMASTATRMLDAEHAALFKKVYRWLMLTVIVGKVEAGLKIDRYFNILGLSEESFSQLKADYSTFTQQGVLPVDALRMAEEKLVIR